MGASLPKGTGCEWAMKCVHVQMGARARAALRHRRGARKVRPACSHVDPQHRVSVRPSTHLSSQSGHAMLCYAMPCCAMLCHAMP